jgi:hypothetical protein
MFNPRKGAATVMKNLNTAALAAGALGALLLAGAAQAAFEGRGASNAIDLSCTVSGPTKCTSFYDSTLDITILNNWNIGTGVWSAAAAAGSAQAVAAFAGFAATGLTGWVLPTGAFGQPAGVGNQYLSIWASIGSTYTGLSNQFDGVKPNYYWSGSEFEQTFAWVFNASNGDPSAGFKGNGFSAVAVRPGDVAAVPEPQTVALLLAGLGVLAVVSRRRPG